MFIALPRQRFFKRICHTVTLHVQYLYCSILK